MNLWLVPVDERSFQRTLADPVDLSDWDDRPDDFPERARVWAVFRLPDHDAGAMSVAESPLSTRCCTVGSTVASVASSRASSI
jgi:hypothetical protein